jgi:hypothetical protein
MMLVLIGCAALGPSAPPKIQPPAPETAEYENGWWKASFQVRWPEDVEPSWWMDLFIAHAMLSPVLQQHRQDMILWRFHRRAARDATGHQFSFLFYSSQDRAERIYTSIQSNGNLEYMKRVGEILRDTYDDTSVVTRPNIQDTSDPNWSVPVKRSWPYFIMGVSQMWLNLIAEYAEKALSGENFSSLEDVKDVYSQINDSITKTWQEEGRHAMLHHLNALFGYEPIAVYEKRLLRF